MVIYTFSFKQISWWPHTHSLLHIASPLYNGPFTFSLLLKIKTNINVLVLLNSDIILNKQSTCIFMANFRACNLLPWRFTHMSSKYFGCFTQLQRNNKAERKMSLCFEICCFCIFQRNFFKRAFPTNRRWQIFWMPIFIVKEFYFCVTVKFLS